MNDTERVVISFDAVISIDHQTVLISAEQTSLCYHVVGRYGMLQNQDSE